MSMTLDTKILDRQMIDIRQIDNIDTMQKIRRWQSTLLAFYAAATERVAAILVTTHTTEQAAEQGGENKTHENQ